MSGGTYRPTPPVVSPWPMADPSSSPVLYPVPRQGEGTLALMAMPRAGEALAADVAALVAAEVTDVVCLLADDEMGRLGLVAEPDVVVAHGLRWHRLPTPDFGLPDEDEAVAVAEAVRERLDRGASVVVHCRAGIGRSSTFAAIVLMYDELEAWKVLSGARGRRVPETGAQRRFAARVAGRDAPRSPLAMQVGKAIGLKLAAVITAGIDGVRARRRGESC